MSISQKLFLNFKGNIFTMEIDGSQKSTTEALFNIMSKGYAMGKTAKAENITCNIRPLQEHHWKDSSMTVTVYEFSPLATTEDYCFHIRKYNRATMCSGSKKVNEVLGPFESSDGWQLEMGLSSSATYIPDIRFWVLIDGK